jgi:hypothetical protein
MFSRHLTIASIVLHSKKKIKIVLTVERASQFHHQMGFSVPAASEFAVAINWLALYFHRSIKSLVSDCIYYVHSGTNSHIALICRKETIRTNKS